MTGGLFMDEHEPARPGQGSSMTLGEAEAWRAGWRAAIEAAAEAVLNAEPREGQSARVTCERAIRALPVPEGGR